MPAPSSNDPGAVTAARATVLTGEPGVGRTAAAAALGGLLVSARPGRQVPLWTARQLRAAATGAVSAVPGVGSLLGDGFGDLLLVLDDAHLLDEASAGVIAELIAGLTGAGPRLVLTVPSGHLVGDGLPAPLRDVLTDLPRYRVRALNVAGVAELVTATVAGPPAPGLATRLHRLTGGVPAAVLGVLADARQAGALRVVGDAVAFAADHEPALPGGHPLLTRVAELPGAAGPIAELLAVTGRRDPDAIADALGLASRQVTDGLAVLRASGLAVSRSDGARLVRPVLRDALAAAVPPWQRVQWQRAALGGATGHLAGCAVRAGIPLDAAAVTEPGRVSDATAARLHAFAGTGDQDAEQALTAKAVRHWAATGHWADIARLPANRIGPAALPLRARALLLTAGLDGALSDVDQLTSAAAPAQLRRLRAELLGLAGAAGAAAAIRADTAAPAGGHFLAEGRPALAAWLGGRWSEVLVLATADRLTGRAAHPLGTAEEAAALAAEVSQAAGAPTTARRWLRDAAPPRDRPAPRVLTDWADAGLDVLLGRAAEGVPRLDGTLRRMRDSGWTRHRELVLARLFDCLLGTGGTERAAEVLAELRSAADTDPSGHARLLWLRATVVFGEHGGPAPTPSVLRDTLDVAVDLALPFELARARLTVGRSSADGALLTAARDGFARLGATRWELRTAGVARALGIDGVPSTTSRPQVDAVVADLVAAGMSNARIAEVLGHGEKFVKRAVSRLLAATGSRHRSQLGARRAEPPAPQPAPASVVDALAELVAAGTAVVALTGAPGSGRSTALRGLAAVLGPQRTVLVPATTKRFGVLVGLVRRLAAVHANRIPALVLARAVEAVRAPEHGMARHAIADAVLDALAHAGREHPLTVLVDDADRADPDSAALLPALADYAADIGFTLVLSGSGPSTVEHAVVVQVPPLTAEQTGATMREHYGRRFGEDVVAAVHQRTGGHRATLNALLHQVWDDVPAALHTALLDPATAVPLRAVAALDEHARGWAGLLAALPGLRVAEAELLAEPLGRPVDAVPVAVRALTAAGVLDSAADGAVTFGIPLLGESVAVGVPAAEVRAAHAAIATAVLADRLAGLAVEDHRLAAHLASSALPGGRAVLAEIAEQARSTDPALAARWSASVLTGDRDAAQRSALVTHADASYELGNYRAAAGSARRALELLPTGDETTRRRMRTVLINSLIRLGEHDNALRLTSEPEPSVLQGMQQSRILLLEQRFDEALGTLARLRPGTETERTAVLAGLRVLAALGAGADDPALWQTGPPAADTDPAAAQQLITARAALAWGDLYGAELAILWPGRSTPATRRTPPPSFVRLSAAIAALHRGEHAAVVALADEHRAAANEQNYVGDVLAALAAEALVHLDEPVEAGARLAGLTGTALFGHVVAWAAAGLDLATGRPEQAVDRMIAADRRCVELGYLPGRELVLNRLVHAHSAAGDNAAAERTLRTLAKVAALVGTGQSTLLWLVSHAALAADERIALRAAELADELGNALVAGHARVLVAVLRANRTSGRRMAFQGFHELDVRQWRHPSRPSSQQSPDTPAPDPVTARDRELIDLIAAGATNTEAAAALHVTEKAIEARLTRLFRRTGRRSRVELVRDYGPRS